MFFSVSLHDAYLATCKREGVKPNSVLARTLPTTVATASDITEVDLSTNFVGARGCKVLLEVAAGMPCLRRLCLRDNQLTNDVVDDLCRHLKQHPSLCELDISRNPISHTGGKALLYYAAHCNSRLIALNANETLLNEGLKKRLDEQIRVNRANYVSSTPQHSIIVTDEGAAGAAAGSGGGGGVDGGVAASRMKRQGTETVDDDVGGSAQPSRQATTVDVGDPSRQGTIDDVTDSVSSRQTTEGLTTQSSSALASSWERQQTSHSAVPPEPTPPVATAVPPCGGNPTQAACPRRGREDYRPGDGLARLWAALDDACVADGEDSAIVSGKGRVVSKRVDAIDQFQPLLTVLRLTLPN